MPPQRPTLRTLAAEAGVSVTTMSFALRNSPEISEATRGRLQRLAAARGYRADPHIAKLMSHLRMKAPARAAANICGLCQDWSPDTLQKENYSSRLCAGLRQRAEELGYAFDLIELDHYPKREQLQRVLLSRGVEGLLVLPMRRPTDLSDRLDWRNFSTVSVTSTILTPQFHRVNPHHFDNMILACRELKRTGFRRIGLAMAKDWDVRINHRWSGGLAWQNQFGGTEPVRALLDESKDLTLDPDTFARWLEVERPDAVVVELLGRDAAPLERVLKRLPTHRRPKIVTVNWPTILADRGIDQRPEQIGRVAIELLAGMINRGEKGIPELPTSTLVDGRWVAGKLRTSPRRSVRKS